ncbi:pyridine nucleotide-disulfide oxidoreductase [Pandoraea sputorum]|uniref:Pyridine nucleotide-disulfide oxidoreductase n=1 Tax=Pandoraea sputorum TaxID=93222 RepID=A0A5E5AW50_9BURK|nr:FAD/NAD(P)-binding oxidoreductase [Pandoraea sputorum]VVE77366.1 pyridine nucleotide-disulfide oxidoreductase [Pandoraea sputorum]
MSSDVSATQSNADIVIMGAGAAGISVAASLRRRRPTLSITIVDPADTHYYQPAWTLVGAGEFDAARTARPMSSVIPEGVNWIQAAVTAFAPERQQVLLSDGRRLDYRFLIVAPGLQLNWEAIDGLSETLGRNGVTSNYRFDLAPYTWSLVREFKGGNALFTQPPMPIKCAGAPQKAMYLSADTWRQRGLLDKTKIEFHLVAPALFGVKDYIPALMEYVQRYRISLNHLSHLRAVDGERRVARFEIFDADGQSQFVDKPFDFLHVVPPQSAPDVLRASPLADAAGWCEVDPATLRHARYANVFGLGDAISAPNAKTAAAARKQAVVVAENLLASMDDRPLSLHYDGYGACPLTVEHGKIVLAEFGYGGKLLPTFPIDGTHANRFAWVLKKYVLPKVYWDFMLRGREWLARPR